LTSVKTFTVIRQSSHQFLPNTATIISEKSRKRKRRLAFSLDTAPNLIAETFYQNRRAALDRQIDRLVYDLYSLTPEDIEIVKDGR
jgi:hypothetical protein